MAEAQTARLVGTWPTFHSLLVPFPIVSFVGALFADLAYARTLDFIWANFAVWMLAFGLVFGGLAALAGIFDFLRKPHVRKQALGLVHALGNNIAILLALVNAFVHSRDGYTAIVPTGITLSALTVVILVFTVPLGKYIATQRERAA
jgi:uncharacterized membrane protein